MNVLSLAAIFDQSTSLQITSLILHFLWQGLAIAIAVLIINRIVARRSPKLQYGVAVVGMIAMISSVAITWFLLQPAASTIEISEMAVSDVPGMQFAPTRAMTDTKPMPESRSALQVCAPAATAIYALGVALMLLRLLFSAIGVGRLRLTSKSANHELVYRTKHLSQRIGLRVTPILKTCERIVVPFVAGVIKPVILLPTLMATGMTQPELDAILLHELAHVRRGDLLVNLLQRIVESLLFFHPAVWYVSRVITVERENCCDDIVLGHCSQKVYASALIRLAEACADNTHDIAPLAALAATGASPSLLKRRVMRILGVTPTRQFHKPGFIVLLACAIAVTIAAVHLEAQTKSEDAQTTEKAPLRRPLTTMLSEDGSIAEFTADVDDMQRLTSILQQLSANLNVVITSSSISRNGKRLKMIVKGEQLDFVSINSAVGTAPHVEALIGDSTKKESSASSEEEDPKNAKEADSQHLTGPVRFEIFGDDQFNVRGIKEDVDRVMDFAEKNWDKNKPARKEADNSNPRFASYRLKHLRAEEVAETLNAAFRDLIPHDAAQKLLIKADAKENRIVVRATELEHGLIENAIKQIGLAAKGRLRLEFRNAPWPDVLGWIAQQTNAALNQNRIPAGTFTFEDSSRTYSPVEALDVINEALYQRGYSLIRNGKNMHILDLDGPDKKRMRELLLDTPPQHLDTRGDFELTKCRFAVGTNVLDVREDVEQLLGPYGSLVVLPTAKQFLVVDIGRNLRSIRSVITEAESEKQSNGDFVTSPLNDAGHKDSRERLTFRGVVESSTGQAHTRQSPRVRLSVEEPRVGSIHVGQTAKVTLDAFPATTYDGRVAAISRTNEKTQHDLIVLLETWPESLKRELTATVEVLNSQ